MIGCWVCEVRYRMVSDLPAHQGADGGAGAGYQCVVYSYMGHFQVRNKCKQYLTSVNFIKLLVTSPVPYP